MFADSRFWKRLRRIPSLLAYFLFFMFSNIYSDKWEHDLFSTFSKWLGCISSFSERSSFNICIIVQHLQHRSTFATSFNICIIVQHLHHWLRASAMLENFYYPALLRLLVDDNRDRIVENICGVLRWWISLHVFSTPFRCVISIARETLWVHLPFWVIHSSSCIHRI